MESHSILFEIALVQKKLILAEKLYSSFMIIKQKIDKKLDKNRR